MTPRWRRNKRPCVLGCGQETYDWDYVCKECRGIVRRGRDKDEIEQRIPKELIEISVAHDWHLIHSLGNAEDCGYFVRSEERIRAALLALLKVNESGTAAGHAFDGVGFIRPFGAAHRVSRWMFLGDEHAGEHLGELIQALRDLAAWEYQEGKREGEEWLAKLVGGELSMDELQDREVQKAK